jgi:L-iditol 2-dehydrogenase
MWGLGLKAVIIKKPYMVSVEDVEVPHLGPNDVLVRVKAVGICASEIHAYRGEHPWRKPPVISGHEFSGVIVEKGEFVKGFEVGDRVTAYIIENCGKCEYCLSSLENLCINAKILGTPQWPGALAEYVRIPTSNIYRLPESLGFEEGALIEPLAVGLHSVRRAGIREGMYVVILGAGAIGLTTLICVKYYGAKVLVSEPIDFKRELARRLGASVVVNPFEEDLKRVVKELTPEGVDVVIDCAGTEGSIKDALEVVKKRGVVVITAMFREDTKVDLRKVMSKEVHIIGSLMYTKREFEEAISLSSKVGHYLRELITHRMNLEEAEKAFKLMIENKAVRIILYP